MDDRCGIDASSGDAPDSWIDRGTNGGFWTLSGVLFLGDTTLADSGSLPS